MGSESRVQADIRLATNLTGGVLFRNNSGAARDHTGRVVRYGLGNDSKRWNETCKSSDLIGITPIMITPEYVGRTMGIFTAIEVKREGWKYRGGDREVAQLYFINMIREFLK